MVVVVDIGVVNAVVVLGLVIIVDNIVVLTIGTLATGQQIFPSVHSYPLPQCP